jgi:hypothetical protein
VHALHISESSVCVGGGEGRTGADAHEGLSPLTSIGPPVTSHPYARMVSPNQDHYGVPSPK